MSRDRPIGESLKEDTKSIPLNGDDLAHQTGRALSWNYAGAFSRLILNFGISITLARLLGPSPFGEIAIAVLLFGLGNLIAGIGLSAALIQKPEISERDVRLSFTGQVATGAAISLFLFLSARVWASFFHLPHLLLSLRVLSPLFLLQAFGATSTALLNRNQNTRPIQIASVVSYFSGYAVIAVPLAFMGFGVWSLVAAYLVQALVNSLILYGQTRHPIMPLVHRDGIGMFRFGVTVLAANICNWGISNLDNTVVGRVAGPIALGLYNRAFNLVQLPTDIIVSNIQQVILPAFSRTQDDTARLGRAFIALVGLVALLLLPPFWAMASIPRTVIVGLYGPKWTGAIRLFQPLALALPLHGLMALSGPTLAARGKPRIELRIQAFLLVIVVIAFVLSVHISVLCLSWTVLGIYLLRFVLMTHVTVCDLELRWLKVTSVLWPSAILACIAALSAASIDRITSKEPASVALVASVVGSGVITVFLAVVGRSIFVMPILRDTPRLREAIVFKLKPMLRGRA